MKYVSECAAAKQVSAYVILNPKGEHVATFRAFHGSTVVVNVFNITTAAQVRSLRAAWTPAVRAVHDKGNTAQGAIEKAAHDKYSFQRGTAGGGGYDKVAAALSGMIIDGHKMTNHCGASLPKPKGATVFPRDFKAPKGYHLANFKRGGDGQAEGYMSCYRQQGLEYLKALGYQVIYAI